MGGTPAALTCSIYAFGRATDRGFAMAALVLSALETIGAVLVTVATLSAH